MGQGGDAIHPWLVQDIAAQSVPTIVFTNTQCPATCLQLGVSESCSCYKWRNRQPTVTERPPRP